MTKPEDAKQTQEDEAREEAGEREQGVRTEDSEDLSSPQLTEHADQDRPAGDTDAWGKPEVGGKGAPEDAAGWKAATEANRDDD